MPAQFLTDRQLVLSSELSENDLIHIVKTGDTTQSPQGSSYKANVSSVTSLIDANTCCISDVVFQNGDLIFYDSQDPAQVLFTVQDVTFQGGPANCIEDFFTYNIYPCTGGTAPNKNITIMSGTSGGSLRNIHFGSYGVIKSVNNSDQITSGNVSTYTGVTTGFTIDFKSETNPLNGATSRLGLNLYPGELPEYTIDFYTYDRASRLVFDDKDASNQNITFSSDPYFMASITTKNNYDTDQELGPISQLPDSGQNTQEISCGLSIGHKGSLMFSGNTIYATGATHESGGAMVSFITTIPTNIDSATNSFINTVYGLNFLSPNNSTNSKPSYIRFYAGTSVSGNSDLPHVHINGTGSTRGFMGVGIGNIEPTSWLDISGTSYSQLRLREPFTVALTGVTAGDKGNIVWSSGSTSYLYIKISDSDTGGHAWRRINLT